VINAQTTQYMRYGRKNSKKNYLTIIIPNRKKILLKRYLTDQLDMTNATLLYY
jgi:hypothetical protein